MKLQEGVKNPKHFWTYVKSKTTSEEPVCDIRYTDSFGKVETASSVKLKNCDSFSSMFNKDKELYSNYLENKNCNTLLNVMYLRLMTLNQIT